MGDLNEVELLGLVNDLKKRMDFKDEELKFLKFRIVELQEEVSRLKFKVASQPIEQKTEDSNVQMEACIASLEEKMKTPLQNMEKMYGSLEEKVLASKQNSEKLFKGVEDNIANLKDYSTKQITNLQNVIFANPSLPIFGVLSSSNNVVFRWVMEEYDQKFKLGKPAYSPIFYTKVCKYSFKLCVEWSGKTKEKMGVFLHINRGSNPVVSLLPFKNEYTMEVHDRYGQSKTHKVSLASISSSPGYFTIKEGRDSADGGYGPVQILNAPYDNYVINDSLHISCHVHL